MVGRFCLPKKDETTSSGADEEVYVDTRDALTSAIDDVHEHKLAYLKNEHLHSELHKYTCKFANLFNILIYL